MLTDSEIFDLSNRYPDQESKVGSLLSLVRSIRRYQKVCLERRDFWGFDFGRMLDRFVCDRLRAELGES
ncbi:hypothetical protein NIES4101_53870 [Calothrix sp. NIES-4101]|nr:hypothetical protein NIES4101_53870 [Calothrix sp. NIES-4101]